MRSVDFYALFFFSWLNRIIKFLFLFESSCMCKTNLHLKRIIRMHVHVCFVRISFGLILLYWMLIQGLGMDEDRMNKDLYFIYYYSIILEHEQGCMNIVLRLHRHYFLLTMSWLRWVGLDVNNNWASIPGFWLCCLVKSSCSCSLFYLPSPTPIQVSERGRIKDFFSYYIGLHLLPPGALTSSS